MLKHGHLSDFAHAPEILARGDERARGESGRGAITREDRDRQFGIAAFVKADQPDRDPAEFAELAEYLGRH